ncbi:yippee-like protein [Ascoidea rubescens DSM 1968]|uniref:Protein yippee-like n=1 Tax=Ascoidea rubescens DSM 1968 TaxID=1344418 RepID=A0A1D2VFQ3_9ASCO|nr:yippee-like protein [Ascoidea rubescens DSM 1968]ODV60307.1 yippee-like protein [Ascoidea rubescens DSM 1968]
MGLRYSTYLEAVGNEKIYGCRSCKTHISVSSVILSKDYISENGRAYLLNNVINTIECVEDAEKIEMLSGVYLICKIKCHQCDKVLGWKYLFSYDKSQNFKVDKYVLELKKLAICY